MTPNNFLKQMAAMPPTPGLLTIYPGPVRMNVGPADMEAAKLILWLLEQLPDEATYGQVDDILDAAKWWMAFWCGLPKPRQGEPDA